jgi:hypothetical protein
MARYRGKKALYEVMSKARVKPGAAKAVEPLHPNKSEQEEKQQKDKEPVVEKLQAASSAVSRAEMPWWKKPRILQLNAGRIEFSLPYQIAVVIILGLIALILIVFRLGQLSMADPAAAGQNDRPANSALTNLTSQENINKAPATNTESSRQPARQAPEAAQSTGNNVIVLTEYGARADLEPVKKFYAQYGVELEIVLENGRYFLQTKDTFDNPNTDGTNGYKMKQKIIQIGAAYKGKAPEGYEQFAPRYFSDAYGKKVK